MSRMMTRSSIIWICLAIASALPLSAMAGEFDNKPYAVMIGLSFQGHDLAVLNSAIDDFNTLTENHSSEMGKLQASYGWSITGEVKLRTDLDLALTITGASIEQAASVRSGQIYEHTLILNTTSYLLSLARSNIVVMNANFGAYVSAGKYSATLNHTVTIPFINQNTTKCKAAGPMFEIGLTTHYSLNENIIIRPLGGYRFANIGAVDYSNYTPSSLLQEDLTLDMTGVHARIELMYSF